MGKVHNKPFFACTGASRNEPSLLGGCGGEDNSACISEIVTFIFHVAK